MLGTGAHHTWKIRKGWVPTCSACVVCPGHPSGHRIGREQLPLSPRRGWLVEPSASCQGARAHLLSTIPRWAVADPGMVGPSRGHEPCCRERGRVVGQTGLADSLVPCLQNVEHCIMVIGVPNMGKSSLINLTTRQHLRKGTASHPCPRACVFPPKGLSWDCWGVTACVRLMARQLSIMFCT